MGFCRLIYRIGRMIFRDFLFKIPKKYLIIVIMFLSFFILKSNVFAYSNGDTIDVQDPVTDLVYYSYGYMNSSYVDSHIIGPYYNNGSFDNKYKLDIKFKVRVNQGDAYLYFVDTQGWGDGFNIHSKTYTNIMEGQYAGSSISVFSNYVANTDYEFIFSLYPEYDITGTLLPYYELYTNGVFSRRTTVSMGTTNFNTSQTHTLKFCAGNAITFKNIKVYSRNTDTDSWDLVYNMYPVKYVDTSNSIQYLNGWYDHISGKFTYDTRMILNDSDILSEVPEDILPSSPFITNESSSIVSWSFDNLNINGGAVENSINGVESNFFLRQVYNDKTINLPINQYKVVDSSTNRVSFNIPRSVLLADSAIINGYSVSFNLDVYTNGVLAPFSLGTYTFDLTQTEQDNINQDRTQQSLDNISQQQQQTTNAINSLNSNITNDNVSNSVIQQPSVPNDTSGVENGVNNIFTVIMNAFTNFDSSQDVILPIPFTDKNITISGNYTRDMLTSVNASWVINFISIFWWYIISVYIVKDILKTVDKIQEGKIDSVENSNIKGDML